MAGKNGALLFGHLLCGVDLENIGSGIRFASGLLSEEYLEHDGFRRRRHRVMRWSAITAFLLLLFVITNPMICTSSFWRNWAVSD